MYFVETSRQSPTEKATRALNDARHKVMDAQNTLFATAILDPLNNVVLAERGCHTHIIFPQTFLGVIFNADEQLSEHLEQKERQHVKFEGDGKYALKMKHLRHNKPDDYPIWFISCDLHDGVVDEIKKLSGKSIPELIAEQDATIKSPARPEQERKAIAETAQPAS